MTSSTAAQQRMCHLTKNVKDVKLQVKVIIIQVKVIIIQVKVIKFKFDKAQIQN